MEYNIEKTDIANQQYSQVTSLINNKKENTVSAINPNNPYTEKEQAALSLLNAVSEAASFVSVNALQEFEDKVKDYENALEDLAKEVEDLTEAVEELQNDPIDYDDVFSGIRDDVETVVENRIDGTYEDLKTHLEQYIEDYNRSADDVVKDMLIDFDATAPCSTGSEFIAAILDVIKSHKDDIQIALGIRNDDQNIIVTPDSGAVVVMPDQKVTDQINAGKSIWVDKTVVFDVNDIQKALTDLGYSEDKFERIWHRLVYNSIKM